MSERELVHQSERCKTKDRSLAARLQSAASTQFAGLRAAGRVCTNTSGDAGMKKASTRLLEETQTPSPAPDLIPAESSLRTYIGIGTANGGTSASITAYSAMSCPLSSLKIWGRILISLQFLSIVKTRTLGWQATFGSRTLNLIPLGYCAPATPMFQSERV